MSAQSKIDILIKAIDNASQTFDAVGKKIGILGQNANQANSAMQRYEQTQRQTSMSATQLATGIIGIGTALLSIYRMIDSVGDAQLRLDKANLSVMKSQEKVNKLQKDYDETLKNTGVDLEKVAKAQHDVYVANHDVSESLEDLKAAQTEYDTLMRTGGVDADKVADYQSRLADANADVETSLNDLNSAQKIYDELLKKSGVDSERIATLQLRLENANERVSDSQKAVNDAQKEYNALLATGGVNLEKVTDLQLALQRATLSEAKSLQSVQEAQQAFNEAQMRQMGHLDPNVKRSQMAGKMADAYDDLQLAQQAYDIATKETAKTQNKLNFEMNEAPTENLETAEEKLTDAQLAYKNATKEASDTQTELNYQMNVAPAEALKKAQEDLTVAQKNYNTATSDATKAQVDLNTAVAGAGAEEYQVALEKVTDAQWNYDEAVYAAGQSQNDLNKALTEIDSDGKAQSALIALQFAQEELALKTEYAREANEALTESYANAAIVGASSAFNIITQIALITSALNTANGATTALKGNLATLKSIGSIVIPITAVVTAIWAIQKALDWIKESVIYPSAPGLKQYEQLVPPALGGVQLPGKQGGGWVGLSGPELVLTGEAEPELIVPKSRLSTVAQAVLAGNIPWKQEGGIFDRPTIIGVGEASAEAVIPLDRVGGSSIVNYYDIKIFVNAAGSSFVEAKIAAALKSVIVKASSSGAPAEQKSIQVGNTFAPSINLHSWEPRMVRIG